MAGTPEELRSAEGAEIQNTIKNNIYKDVILTTGKVFMGNKKALTQNISVWTANHSSFMSSCDGKVYIVAQADDGINFLSRYSACSVCNNPPQIHVSISKEDLQKKLESEQLVENGNRALERIDMRINIPNTPTS